MATFFYNRATGEIVKGAAGTIDLLGDTVKVMLVKSGYVPDRDHDFVDEGGANDPIDHELTVGGYAGGFGGAGRKTLASKTVVVDKANDRAEFDAADITWTALATGETIVGAILIKEITNDAASPVIAYLDITDTPTNGSDFTLQMDAQGILQFKTA